MECGQATLSANSTSQLLGNKERSHSKILDRCMEPDAQAYKRSSSISDTRQAEVAAGNNPANLDSGDGVWIQKMETE